MSYQYYDQGYGGVPKYPGEQPYSQYYHQQQQQPRPRRMPLPSQQPRRGPPPADVGYGPSPHVQRPMRPDHSGAGISNIRSRQNAQPPMNVDESLYDGSAYGGSDYVEYESDQWPLQTPLPQYQQERRAPSPKQSNPRRPPQRPQRPDAQPSARPQHPARVAQQLPPPPPPPVHHGSGQWTGDAYTSPSSYPLSQTPVLSQQYPYQQGAYGQANKRPPLGPPPSARRGPASYYPQVGPVHPIVEETDSMRSSVRTGAGRDSNRSYASSNAIPIGIPDYYLQQQRSTHSLSGPERPFSEDPTSIYSEDDMIRPPPPLHLHEHQRDSIEEEKELMENERQEPSPEPAALVRQASLGRKSKPTLMTVKGSDRVRKASSQEGIAGLPSQQRARVNPTPLEKETGQDSGRHSEDSGTGDKEFEAGVAAAGLAAPVFVQGPRKSRDNMTTTTRSSEDVLAGGTGLLDPSSSESENSVKNRDLQKKRSSEILGLPFSKRDRSRSRDRSQLGKEVDGEQRASRQIMAGLAAGSALDSKDDESDKESEELRQPMPGFSARAGKRRPPRLNVDAVRDAEARGSLTSLPDLIKRATRLASNLDRGKTASRLGMNWLEGAPEAERKENEKRTSGSISDILANFPPPGANGSPPGSRNGFRSSWRGRGRHSRHLPSESDAGEGHSRKRGRRCCGMPLWLFIILLLLLIALVAAAVVVPVVLVVVPKQDGNGSDSASTKALQNCQSNLKCANGGANVITTAGSCKCVCVNGFTGSTCGTNSEAGCTTTSVGGTSNATVGDEIPRLLSGASSNFSVPLNGQTLLGLFSDADLSCATENALVAFSGNSKRHLVAVQPVVNAAIPRARRQDTTSTTSSSNGVATSEGIIYQTGTPTKPPSSSAATTSSTSPAASTSTGSSSSNSTTFDFSRVAVLYIFQVSGELSSAATAQSNLQTFFSKGQNADGQSISASNVSLGGGYSANLQNYAIDLGNGTTVG